MRVPERNEIADRHTRRRPASGGRAGYLAKLPTYRSSPHAGGQLLYLPLTGRIVVPHHRTPDGWECVVVADPAGLYRAGMTLPICDLEIETGLPASLRDPVGDIPVESFAAVWLARVWERTPGGHRYAVARVLAEDLCQPGTRAVTLDDAAVRRVVNRAHVLPPGLRRLLDNLSRDRLLTRIQISDETSPPVYHLSLPDQKDTEPPGQPQWDTRM